MRHKMYKYYNKSKYILTILMYLRHSFRWEDAGFQPTGRWSATCEAIAEIPRHVCTCYVKYAGRATRLHIFCYFCAEKVRPKYEAYHTPYIINGNHCARNNRHIGTHVGADAGVAQAWHSARTVASITALPAHRLRSAGRNRLHGFVSQHMLLERRAEREF